MWKIPKKRKMIAGAALLIVVCLGLLWLMPADKPQIQGDIPIADIVEIEKVARREIWRGSLPDFSWRSIKQFPSQVYHRMRIHVLVITSFQKTNHPTQVDFSIGGGMDFFLKKTSNGWEQTSTVFF